MRAQLPEWIATPPRGAEVAASQPDAARRLLEPLVEATGYSDYLVSGSVGVFQSRGRDYNIPRFVFMGPKGGGDRIRFGLFAALQGDDQVGPAAVVEFLRQLEANPQAGAGFQIHAYPLCNPTGFEDGTPHARGGRDLTREFWRGSRQPEVYFLEREVGIFNFHGVILFQSADRAGGLRVSSPGSILTESLAVPAVAASQPHLPPDAEATQNALPVRLLTATNELLHPPFELTLETPRSAPPEQQVRALVAALHSLLASYLALQSFRPNI
jgi:protein MpaA